MDPSGRKSSRARSTLFIGLLALGSVGFYCILRARGSADFANVRASGPQVQPLPTRLEFVRAFLGEHWPLLQPLLTKEHLVFLAEPFRADDHVSWVDAKAKLREQIREGLQAGRLQWIARFRDLGLPTDFASGKLNPTAKNLDPRDLDRVQEIIDSAAIELDPLANLAFDLVAEAEEAIWDEGRYDVCPFISASLTTQSVHHGQFIHKEKWQHDIWNVSFVLDSSDWPMLDAVLTEMAVIGKRRDKAIADHIAGV